MRKADRDLAEQLVVVRGIAANVPITDSAPQLTETVTACQDDGSVRPCEEGEKESCLEVADWPTRLLFAEDDMVQRLAWARRLRPDARDGVLAALQRAADAGPARRIGRAGSSVEFNQLREEFPHFHEVLNFVWKRAVLAGSVPDAALQLPPMLFDGPPGVGKSAFAERLAAWLAMPITRVDMSNLDAAFKLTGLDAGYSTGKPGMIWDALQGPFISPVLLLDEIDKTSTINSGGSTFLLGLLEPLTASRFQDACIGLPINAAHIQWMATSNELSAIDAPLRSRFRVFAINLPTGDQRCRVVQSVYRQLRKQEIWARAFPETLPLGVVEALMDRTARDARHALEDACASAVADDRRDLSIGDVPAPPRDRQRSIGFVNQQFNRELMA
jgi:ATP-dependent Lon protease